MPQFDDTSTRKPNITQTTTTTHIEATPPLGDIPPAQLALNAAEGRRGAAWRLMTWIIEDDSRALEAVASLEDDRLAHDLLEFIALGNWAGKPFVVPPRLRSPYARIRLSNLFQVGGAMTRERAERVLFAGFRDRRPEVRGTAITILGEMGDRAAEPLLLQALHDPSHQVRMQAVRALGKLRDPSVVPTLLETLKGGDEQMVNQVFAALVRIGPPAIAAVAHEMRSASPQIRWHCMRAFGEMQDFRAIPYLVTGLLDPDTGVCWMAAKGLVSYGKSSLEPVLHQLESSVPNQLQAETSCYILHQLYLRNSKLAPYLKPVVEAFSGVANTLAVSNLASKALTQLHADHMLSA